MKQIKVEPKKVIPPRFVNGRDCYNFPANYGAYDKRLCQAFFMAYAAGEEDNVGPIVVTRPTQLAERPFTINVGTLVLVVL